MKVVLLGDMHFSCTKDWSTESFNKFIKWFSDYDFGKKEDVTLVQLGDVVDKASNPGDTLELVARFFCVCCEKFSKIYIVGGNHDHHLFNDKSRYATQFVPYLGDSHQIENIFEETVFEIAGLKVIALPHRRINGKILEDYYNNELNPLFYSTEADIICGHVAIKEPKSFYGGINISKFKAKHHAFGHIHVRNGTYRNHYTGSIMPFKIDEMTSEIDRCIKVIDSSTNKESEIKMPQFISYEDIQFQETPLYKKESDDIIHIYTVHNCKNLQQAKSFYPSYYIRGVEKVQNSLTTTTGEKAELFITPLNALDAMIRETKMVIKRRTLALLKSILS
jgi:DNA repair exonuclease SbcCD nuclease subunit